MEDRVLDRIVQRLVTRVGSIQTDPEKKFNVERLKALGATTFDGATDPEDVEDRKVELATFLLQKGVGKWWKVIVARRSNLEAMSWPEFRKIFEDKYYPSAFREAKRDEFLRLTQGSMTFAKYEQRFSDLSQYALPIIAEEKERCRRFVNGLRRRIHTPITSTTNWVNFTQLVVTAIKVERSVEGRHTTDRCGAAQDSNRDERQTGHFKKDCPQLVHGAQGEQRVVTQVVHQPRATRARGEGSGAIKQKRSAYVLFDPGATHSFISSMSALHIDRVLEHMNDDLFISTPVGDTLVVHEYYRSCEIVIRNGVYGLT
ncbi:uncharacterized protein LOC120069826 [Benincasa hispida]|uniref:uncharacterized protein LOC120069826 n=1 Tax=Benincasa hispida TaxID=102211 RepID=UPI00190260B3|nr:uncharacterized protein LOC120069826 [Benincasa hispida]